MSKSGWREWSEEENMKRMKGGKRSIEDEMVDDRRMRNEGKHETIETRSWVTNTTIVTKQRERSF